MAFYAIMRWHPKESWHGLSQDQRDEWMAGLRKTIDDSGMEVVKRYRSYLGKGTTVIRKVPNFEAWDEYFMKVNDASGLSIGHYFDIDYDFCFELEGRAS